MYYEDTDVGGVVYHSNYLNFCERARSERFFSKGSSPMFDEGHFVVRELQARYVKPARLGDLLDVTVEMIDMNRASMRIRQQVFKAQTLLFEMQLKLVYLDTNGTLKKLDPAQQQRLRLLLDG